MEERKDYKNLEDINFSNTSSTLPKTWLVESILVTILCCLPFGIAGIIYASRVESKFAAGDVKGAKLDSKEAGKWTKIGFFIGLATYVLGIIIFVVAVGAGVANGEFD